MIERLKDNVDQVLSFRFGLRGRIERGDGGDERTAVHEIR
jgi:hypothetical protein